MGINATNSFWMPPNAVPNLHLSDHPWMESLVPGIQQVKVFFPDQVCLVIQGQGNVLGDQDKERK
jgi:hypothetical protein